MQAGRGAKARKAAQSHTGALIGDWATMQTQVEDAGAIVVSTMDEMMDLVQILVRYPVPPTKGPGILTASGAYVGLTNDFAEDVGLDLPELDPATLKRVKEVLPSFGNYGNPLDVTAGFSPEALTITTKALLDDPNVGMLFISFPISRALQVVNFNKGMVDSPKPKVMVALGDNWAARSRRAAGCRRKSGGVFALVGPHVACDHALYPLRTLARPYARGLQSCALSGHAQAQPGRATGVAGQEDPVGRRHPRARWRACPHA